MQKFNVELNNSQIFVWQSPIGWIFLFHWGGFRPFKSCWFWILIRYARVSTRFFFFFEYWLLLLARSQRISRVTRCFHEIDHVFRTRALIKCTKMVKIEMEKIRAKLKVKLEIRSQRKFIDFFFLSLNSSLKIEHVLWLKKNRDKTKKQKNWFRLM